MEYTHLIWECALLFEVMSRVRGASLVAQMIKRLPAMLETWVRFLGQEDPLEKEMATHSSIHGESHGQRSLVGYSSPWGSKSQTRLSN